jgi:hypothetical protein
MAKQARVRPSWKKQNRKSFKHAVELHTRYVRKKVKEVHASRLAEASDSEG